FVARQNLAFMAWIAGVVPVRSWEPERERRPERSLAQNSRLHAVSRAGLQVPGWVERRAAAGHTDASAEPAALRRCTLLTAPPERRGACLPRPSVRARCRHPAPAQPRVWAWVVVQPAGLW